MKLNGTKKYGDSKMYTILKKGLTGIRKQNEPFDVK